LTFKITDDPDYLADLRGYDKEIRIYLADISISVAKNKTKILAELEELVQRFPHVPKSFIYPGKSKI